MAERPSRVHRKNSRLSPYLPYTRVRIQRLTEFEIQRYIDGYSSSDETKAEESESSPHLQSFPNATLQNCRQSDSEIHEHAGISLSMESDASADVQPPLAAVRRSTPMLPISSSPLTAYVATHLEIIPQYPDIDDVAANVKVKEEICTQHSGTYMEPAPESPSKSVPTQPTGIETEAQLQQHPPPELSPTTSSSVSDLMMRVISLESMMNVLVSQQNINTMRINRHQRRLGKMTCKARDRKKNNPNFANTRKTPDDEEN